MESRADIRKTYKLFIGGAFPRSESGRSYKVDDSKGVFLANAALASRKDARDAVLAARSAQPKWWDATAYNRGQILYRVAEMIEGRRGQFEDDVVNAEGVSRRKAATAVDAAIDRWVWYAGWADKIAQVLGSSNPVAGPYFNFSVPEPTGGVAAVAPQDSSLLGLVSVVAPIIVGGNTVIVVASQNRPLPAVTLAEVLATSDVPGGVVNILTCAYAEISPRHASHAHLNALDLTGVDDAELAKQLAVDAAVNVKRVLPPPRKAPDWFDDPGLDRIRAFVETTTVWHPIGV
jgi:acyl-CoA reductase-like NAD-dependent aldehyde dehydrogenase